MPERLFHQKSSRTLWLPCSLKQCHERAEVEIPDAGLPGNHFVLCPDCEQAVMINVIAEIEASGALPDGYTSEFLNVMGAWRRRRKGVTLPHRPLTITVHEVGN